MSRISIDVSSEQHQKLKAIAALKGMSIKDFVIESTLGASEGNPEREALADLERMLDERMRSAKSGAVSKRTVSSIFKAESAGR
jgi:uncharacterized protein (DUF1778 family)